MDDFRRLGRFTAPAQWAHEFRTELKRVMGQCIVFRAEHLFHSDQIEYFAASEHFRPVPMGEVVPEYRWIFSDTDGIRAEEIGAHGVTTCREPEPLKDHEIALIVNELRDIAKTYGQTQQLRQRIADVIVPRLRRYGVKPTAGVQEVDRG